VASYDLKHTSTLISGKVIAAHREMRHGLGQPIFQIYAGLQVDCWQRNTNRNLDDWFSIDPGRCSATTRSSKGAKFSAGETNLQIAVTFIAT
jgi:hypothetical protein